MSSVLARSAWPAGTFTGTTRSVTFTLPAGTGRRLVVISAAGNDTTGLTFDGVSMTKVGTTELGSGAYLAVFAYDVPDVMAADDYELLFSFDEVGGHTYRAWVVEGAVGSIAAYLDLNPTGTATAVGVVAADDIILAFGCIGNPSGTDAASFGSAQVTTADGTGTSSLAGFRAIAADAIGDADESVSWSLVPYPGTEECSVLMVVVPALAGGGGGDPALVVDEQPSATPSGYAIDPAPVVVMTTDGVTVDTSFTGDVTAELIGTGGGLFGTLTVTAVAGVATFSDLRPCEAGTYSLRFSSPGETDVDSDPFTVTSGSGATFTGGDVPTVQIRRNEPTASLRRIYLLVFDEAGDPWAGSTSGVKSKLSTNGGSETDAPADIVRVGGALHYTDTAQAYTDASEGAKVLARLPGASGRREAVGIAEIIPADSYTAAVTETSLTNKIVRAVNGADGYVVTKDPDNGQITLVIPGVGTITIPARFVDTSKQIDALGTT